MKPIGCYLAAFLVILVSGSETAFAQRRTLAAADATTQAGCDCLASTYQVNASTSVKLDGCANPDKDPKGDWCPVDPAKCPGRYGSYTWQGKTVYYDYCGKVRATTTNGCLCLAESQGIAKQGDGLGKPSQDQCFSDVGAEFFCYVATKTCKKLLTGAGKEKGYDMCTSAPVDTSAVPKGTKTSQGGCKCASQWSYHPTETPSDEQGPFDGCANPGFDPKGPWCVVSTDCATAYGTYQDAFTNKQFKYAYCGDVLESTQAGCLCKPVWGGGKQQDRCANPDGKATVWCEFVPGTCKNVPFGTTWDYCGKLPAGLTPPKNNSGAMPPAPLVVVVPAGNSSADSASRGGKDKSNKSINKVVLLVPLLTGCAALVTIAYTLYKCHKKRQFFKSSALLKLAHAVNEKASPAGPSAEPVAGPGPVMGHPVNKNTV